MQDSVSSNAYEAPNSQVAQYQHELFGQCRNTLEAFQGLGDVAEDMRILSLNAELAAGRAGSYGVSIRALTQYTRELVNRLEQINLEMAKVEAFKETDELEQSEAEPVAYEEETYQEAEYAEEATYDDYSSEEYAESDYAQGDYDYGDQDYENAGYTDEGDQAISALLAKFEDENGGVKYLNEQAKRIAEVVSQSNSIATNMAIEAATAGQYEGTFTNVANDMRGFVDTLKNMVTRAQDSIEKAFRAEKGLKELEASARQ